MKISNGLLGLFLTLTVGATTASEMPQLRIAIGIVTDVEALAVEYCMENGLCDATGIKVTKEPLQYSAGAAAFVAGEVEAGIMAAPIISRQVTEGDVCGKWVYSTTKAQPTLLIGTVPSVKDLDGKTIAINAPGSFTDGITQTILRNAGISAATSRVGKTSLRVLDVMSGSSQATIAYQPFAELGANLVNPETGARMHRIMGPEELPQIPSAGILVNCDFVEQYPEQMHAVVEAFLESAKQLVDPKNKENALAFIKKKMGLGDRFENFGGDGTYGAWVPNSEMTAEKYAERIYEHALIALNTGPAIDPVTAVEAVNLMLLRQDVSLSVEEATETFFFMQ